MRKANPELLSALGGEDGCRRLSADFYGRVAKDATLRPLFPGKSFRCAIDEFAAFLIQFLGGDEEQTQHRWWLSLQESHSRFQIGPLERKAWLKQMGATLNALPLDTETRQSLIDFFVQSSGYVIGKKTAHLEHEELAERWRAQCVLDETIRAIAEGRDQEVRSLAPSFSSRPTVFIGLLVRMLKSGRSDLIDFVLDTVKAKPSLIPFRFAGRSLLHFAAAAGCLEVVSLLLKLGLDPNLKDEGDHTPLYAVANGWESNHGPEIVQALVQAGADVNANGGVTRATALHMAARRGFVEIARTLIDCGASLDAKDSKGATPLRRAINCRKPLVAKLLIDRGAFGLSRNTMGK